MFDMVMLNGNNNGVDDVGDDYDDGAQASKQGDKHPTYELSSLLSKNPTKNLIKCWTSDAEQKKPCKLTCKGDLFLHCV